jgi:hypothetical protein
MPINNMKKWIDKPPKEEKPVEVKSPLEDVRNLPKHIFGRIGEFELEFKPNGIIKAKREYKNLEVFVVSCDENGKLSERKAIVPLVTINTQFDIILHPDRLVDFRKTETKFSFDEEKRTMKAMHQGRYVMWLEDEKPEQMHFREEFNRNLSNELLLLRDKIKLVLKVDPIVAPALSAEISRMTKLWETVNSLADTAEKTALENNLDKTPIAIFPVFSSAEKKEVLHELLMEIGIRRKESISESVGKIGPEAEESRNRAERLEKIADVLEEFIKIRKEKKEESD